MSTSLPVLGGHPTGVAGTQRSDNWWVGPLLTFSGLMAFIVYATWAALQAEHFTAGPYLSPFYSPVLFAAPNGEGLAHAWFGEWPAYWPAFIPASPAVIILIFPGSLRFTCYYYRKAYYRSYAGSPPACGVVPFAGNKTYYGETRLLLFQNLHRYALYASIPFIPILYYDAFLACSYEGQLGFGLGTLIMFINATLLGAFLFGCHAFRHLIGGHSDCMSCGKQTLKYSAWKKASWLNGRHMLLAWLSLFWVGFTDFYIRMVSMGVIPDMNTWS